MATKKQIKTKTDEKKTKHVTDTFPCSLNSILIRFDFNIPDFWFPLKWLYYLFIFNYSHKIICGDLHLNKIYFFSAIMIKITTKKIMWIYRLRLQKFSSVSPNHWPVFWQRTHFNFRLHFYNFNNHPNVYFNVISSKYSILWLLFISHFAITSIELKYWRLIRFTLFIVTIIWNVEYVTSKCPFCMLCFCVQI